MICIILSCILAILIIAILIQTSLEIVIWILFIIFIGICAISISVIINFYLQGHLHIDGAITSDVNATNEELYDKFKGKPPYASQYVGSYQTLLGWKGQQGQDWVRRQVGYVINSLKRAVEIEPRKLEKSRDGTFYRVPGLLYNPYKWLHSILNQLESQKIDEMLKELNLEIIEEHEEKEIKMKIKGKIEKKTIKELGKKEYKSNNNEEIEKKSKEEQKKKISEEEFLNKLELIFKEENLKNEEDSTDAKKKSNDIKEKTPETKEKLRKTLENENGEKSKKKELSEEEKKKVESILKSVEREKGPLKSIAFKKGKTFVRRKRRNLINGKPINNTEEKRTRAKLDLNSIKKIILNIKTLEQKNIFLKYFKVAIQTYNKTPDISIQKTLWWIYQALSFDLVVSPLGILDLYRYYFYDFGNFLGIPIEHVWIAPYSEVELLEINSTTSYRFREYETSLEVAEAQEKEIKESTDISEEIERNMMADFKTGITAEGGVQFSVWHVNGSSSMDFSTHLEKNKKEMRKRLRELSSKTTTQLKRSVRTLTRESVEKRTESSRRHLIKNPSDKLINYEMRRKLRKVGIQVQRLGQQLAWQIYIDEPGFDLGLSELVHIAKPEDFNVNPPADLAPPTFDVLTTDYSVPIPNDGNSYFKFTSAPPQTSYQLEAINLKGYERMDPDEDNPDPFDISFHIIIPGSGEWQVELRNVDFKDQPGVRITVELIWNINYTVRLKAEESYLGKMGEYQQHKQAEAKFFMVQNLRERIELARSVEPRSSEDLRNEERTALYRRCLERLMGSFQAEDLHPISEKIRILFEVDKMLYFVAPDWWNPRIEYYKADFSFDEEEEFINVENIPIELHTGDLPEPLDDGTYIVEGTVSGGDNPDTDNITADLIMTTSEVDLLNGNTATSHYRGDIIEAPIDISTEKFVIRRKFWFSDGPGFEVIVENLEIPNPYYQLYLRRGNPIDDSYKIRFGKESGSRQNNYLITDKSEPAPLGSSIGWLLQLDGDNHRNAFLNAAWAKIVIPIRKGFERVAIEWLLEQNIEGTDNLNTLFEDFDGFAIGPDLEHPMTVKEVLNDFINKIEEENEADKTYRATQWVYENGFNPLEGGTDFPAEVDIFSQWIEIVPTNQIVPVSVDYKKSED